MKKDDKFYLVKNENPADIEARIIELKFNPADNEVRSTELKTEFNEIRKRKAELSAEFNEIRKRKTELSTEFNEIRKHKIEFNKLRRCKTALKKTVINLAGSIEGWMSKKELSWLFEIAVSYKDKIEWIEIGSWKGKSLTATALGLPKFSRLFCVDPHTSNENLIQLDVPIPYVKKSLLLTIELIKELRPDLHIEHFAEVSENVSEKFKNGQLDVVFIDGCHEHELVKKDIELWIPKIKKDGIICGHDRKKVTRAIKDTLGEVSKGHHSIWHKRIQ